MPLMLLARTRLLTGQITSIHAAALIIGAAGFLSRVLGLFRDRLLASRFGAGDTLDAYYAAFQIPDALYTIFLIGAASAAILPIFIEYRESGKDYWRFIQTVLTVFSALAVVFVLILIAFAPFIMSVIVPGFSGEKLRLATTLTRIIMLGPLFFGISGIISSVFQAHHRFLIYAIPPIFYNLAIIFGIVALVPAFGATGLAWGVLIGSILQVLVQLPVFVSLGFKPKFAFNLTDEGLRRVVALSAPRVAALSFNQLTVLALIAVASFFASGSVAIFKFAANLMYFPVGIFGVSYALAIFPKLSESAIKKRGFEFFSELSSGIRSIIFWSLPIAFLFIVLRAHIVRVVLGAGVFDWDDTRLVAASLAVLSAMIVFEGLNTLFIRAFYALEKTWEPLISNIIASIATMGAALALFVFFSVSPPSLKALSEVLRIGDIQEAHVLIVAMAFSFGSILNFSLLSSKLYKTAKAAFGTAARESIGPIAKIFAASLIGGFTAYLFLLPFPALISTRTLLGIAAQGVTAGLMGFAAYFATLYFSGAEEFLSLLESFRQRLYSPKKQPKVYELEKLDGQEPGK